MSKYNPIIWLRPGDPGYNPNERYPWSGLGELAGFDQKPSTTIFGFFLIDMRQNPPMVIFENMEFPHAIGVRPTLLGTPQPFRSPGAAFERIKRMHLPAEQEEACLHQCGPIRLCALAPHPGFGRPKPNTLVMDRSAFNSW